MILYYRTALYLALDDDRPHNLGTRMQYCGVPYGTALHSHCITATIIFATPIFADDRGGEDGRLHSSCLPNVMATFLNGQTETQEWRRWKAGEEEEEEEEEEEVLLHAGQER